MTETQEQPQTFPWEGAGPKGEFWSSLEDNYHAIGQQVLKVFGAETVANFPLDASLDQSGKIKQLYAVSTERLSQDSIVNSPTPETLSRDDWTKWYDGQSLLDRLESELGEHGKAVDRVRRLKVAWEKRFELGNDPEIKSDKNVGILSTLSYMLLKAGQYAEAEEIARPLPDLFRDHPFLGPGPSPQELGTRRMLMETLAKQGKLDEAAKLNEEGYGIIAELAKGKFAKYEHEEIEAMDEVKENLPKWASQTGAVGAVGA